ncbi:MAG: hypothetical protein M0P77_09915 [Firmicutes bacterium]|nr:hypothetical protein [Bacillota bacterium]
MKRVIKVLEQKGPMLSGELANYLQMEYDISNATARKAISRATTPVHKIEGIGFEKNQKYMYLKEQFNNEIYFKNLFNAFKESSKNYYQILLAIRNNGGFISKKVLASYVAAPVENLTSHKRYDLLVRKLIELKFIHEYTDGYYQLIYFNEGKVDIRNTKAIELAKKTVIDDFSDWAKKINLIAYNSPKGFFEYANFAKFQWAFTAPSYINDIEDKKNGKPGFFIGDIIIGKNADVDDVQFFIDKIDIIKHYKNLPNFIPMIISENFTKEAHRLLKEKGVICAKISNLFSSNYSETLKELVHIMRNASTIIRQNPDKFIDYTNKISSLEGKMGNLIGDLFEAAVGYYFHMTGCKYFELNKIVRYNHFEKEIDIYVEKDGKIKIIECKGIKSELDHEYVVKWTSDNIPVIYKSIKEINSSAIIEFELWSIGGYTDDSIEFLNKVKINTKKYSINYFNAKDIIKKAKECRCNVLLKSINSILK